MFVCRYDSRVKAMELDERPTEEYSDIGGLDKQIEEVSCCRLFLYLVPLLYLQLYLKQQKHKCVSVCVA